MKRYMDIKQREKSSEEGSWVWLKLQSYRKSTVASKKNS